MASKVQDGLFIGDAGVAVDAEFLEANKVTRVVNCAAGEVANIFNDVLYFSVDWREGNAAITSDLMQRIGGFIRDSHAEGESVLVHSKTGRCRSPALVVAWLGLQYKWTVAKSVEFLKSKTVVEIPRNVMEQLERFEKSFESPESLSTDWNNTPNCPEELILFNTYINSRGKKILLPNKFCVPLSVVHRGRRKRVDWTQSLEQPPSRKKSYFSQIALKPILKQPTNSNVSTAASSPVIVPAPFVRSMSRQPSPARVTAINGLPSNAPSLILTSALRTIRQAPSIASLGAFKPTASRVIIPPPNFPKVTSYAHARAPSPMVRHNRAPSPAPRAPSPALRAPSREPVRRTASPFTSSIRINEGQVLPVIATYRRSPSPMLSRPSGTTRTAIT